MTTISRQKALELYKNLPLNSYEFIYKKMGLKSETKIVQNLTRLDCPEKFYNDVLHWHEVYLKEAFSFVGQSAEFDITEQKESYKRLLNYIGCPDYLKLSNKKRSSIIDEQNRIYKLIQSKY